MKLAGVVILYNPDQNVISNILTYVNELETLFVLDNSEFPRENIIKSLKQIPQIRYIAFGNNRGISYALNYALKACHDYEFLLTMDQDSFFTEGGMRQYISAIEKYRDANIAAYSIQYTTPRGVFPTISISQDVKRTITSGMVINIRITKKIGGFAEELFIDGVDHEYCYRAHKNHYRIWKFCGIVLHHKIGNPEMHHFLWKNCIVSNHSAIRRYYIIRNNIYISRRYSQNLSILLNEIVKTPIKIFLFEKDKRKKIKAIGAGILDGILGKMGKCERSF